ncbi:Ribosome biogenesis protein 1 [Mitosporidium daphniae]
MQATSLDAFLSSVDNPSAWRTIAPDGEPLTREELEIITALFEGTTADIHFDPFAPSIDFFTGTVQHVPVALNTNPPKRGFLPSAHEAKKVKKLVHAIRQGWIKRQPEECTETDVFFDLWSSSVSDSPSIHSHIAAPKITLPGHRESYRPLPEYLATSSVKEHFEKSVASGKPSRKWIPTSYSSLRHVPGYPYAMQERFSRCLDLYLCPRAKKSRLNIDPESMLPKLPELSDLRPYPNVLGLKLDATTYPTSSPITSMAIDATGHWLLAGFADGSLTLSDVIFGKTYAKWLISEGEDPVSSIAWNPTAQLGSLAAISCGSKLILLNLFIGSSVQQSLIGNLFNALQKNESWIQKRLISLGKEIPLEVVSFAINSHAITRLAWHRKGDYLASVAPKANNSAIIIHQLSKASFQLPFKKIDGTAVDAAFHPTKPYFFLVTQRAIRSYDLSKQLVQKRIDMKGLQNVSCMSVHPHGEHVIVGSLDCRVSWFDMELSNAYKTLRYHKDGVRALSYHQKYPLFASCSDDGNAHICYAKVFDDSSLQNPLVVPVKILKPVTPLGKSVALNSLAFHPSFPWIYLGSNDGSMQMYLPTIY